MSTPFDTILRVVGRDVDAARSQVGAAAGLLAQAELAREAAILSFHREAIVAAADRTMAAEAYFAAAAARRERLHADHLAADANLDTVRQAALAAYGSLRAVEGAATRFRLASDLRTRAAEQSAIDDFIGARFSRDAQRRHQAGRPRGGFA